MWGQRPLFLVLLLPLLLIGHAAAGEKPTVVSTNPANGALGAPKTLTSITITFNKPMDSVCRGVWTSNWIEGGSTCQWSADKLTMTFTRVGKTTPLTANATVGVTLNPMAYPPEIRDTEGNYLDPYYFSFTIEGESPVVTATDTVNNATDVSRTLASFSFTFNRAMDTSLCIPARKAGGIHALLSPYRELRTLGDGDRTHQYQRDRDSGPTAHIPRRRRRSLADRGFDSSPAWPQRNQGWEFLRHP